MEKMNGNIRHLFIQIFIMEVVITNNYYALPTCIVSFLCIGMVAQEIQPGVSGLSLETHHHTCLKEDGLHHAA